MFHQISQWFEQQIQSQSQKEQSSEYSVKLATSVLLYEIMRADDQFDEREEQVLQKRLADKFSMSDGQVQELMSQCQSVASEAADFHQFTKVLNDQFQMEQKVKVLDALWDIAFADKQLDPEEEYLIRKIADLLYIPHSEYIQSKLKIMAQNDQ